MNGEHTEEKRGEVQYLVGQFGLCQPKLKLLTCLACIFSSLGRLNSFREASGYLSEIVLLGDRGINFGHQEHPRRPLYRVKRLHDSQIVGCKYGGATGEDY